MKTRHDTKERRTGIDSERGAALILTLLVIMTLTVLGVGVIMSISTNKALSRNYEVAIQARNMAEIGAKVAYREFITGGFLRTTHTLDQGEPAVGDSLLITTLDNYTVEADGDFLWEWDSEKTYDPMWETETPHGFRFRVYYYTPTAFVIESEGWYGPITRRVRAKGEIETMFQFSYFASRDLGEFTRGASQQIRGKVHANGNMYVRPDGADLNVNTDSFTATGFIIRTRDAWGRPDQSGRCFVSQGGEGGAFVEMTPNIAGARGTDGSAFDSFYTNWAHQTLGARTRWGGVVRDRVPFKSPPPVQNLDLGEYYQQIAQTGGVVITNTTHVSKPAWCTRVTTMWNWNEQRFQTIWNVNVGAMMAAGDWPANNLIYCEVPVRLSNAATLQNKLMVASCRNIYTLGNFNTVNKKGASIMTRHRIYHLSSIWSDAQSTDSKNRAAATTTINGALVDCAPTVDEYNWADRDDDRDYDFNGQVIYDDWNNKTAGTFHNPANSGNPWANCDDLLEKWSGITLTKLGSTVHMGVSYDIMCPSLTNAGITDDQLAWVLALGYAAPVRVFSYDPDLATAAGQPPFTPLIGHITSWEPY